MMELLRTAVEIKSLRRRLWVTLKSPIQILAVAVIVSLATKLFVLDAVFIPSASMEGTLYPGDYVLVDKFLYGPASFPFLQASVSSTLSRKIERGDVIVFSLPTWAGQGDVQYVKRCVALPGEVIEIRDGELSVNNRLLRQGLEEEINLARLMVPKRGDKIDLSASSFLRWKDLIEDEGHSIARNAFGEILVDNNPVTSYTVERDYLFVLGDNAAASYDSRHWGFLPMENIIGQAMAVYWSTSTGGDIHWHRIGSLIH